MVNDMPTLAELTVMISGNTASLSAALGRAEKDAGNFAGNVTSKMGKAFGDVAKIASGVIIGQGLMQAPGFFMDATQAAADHAAEEAKLKQAVDNTGVSYDSQKGKLDDYIAKGKALGFSYGDQVDALSLLTAQTGNADDAMSKMALAADVARGTHMDLYSASKLLGKMTDENVNVFARMGIVVDKNATQTEVLALLQQKFGGQADAYAKSTAGQMEAAKLQMKGLEVQIGTALLPVMTKLVDVVATDLIPAGQAFVAEWGPKVKQAFEEMEPKIKEFVEYFKTDVIPTVQAVITFFQDNWPTVAPVVEAALNNIKVTLETLLKIIGDIINFALAVIRGDWDEAWDSLKTLVSDTFTGIYAIVQAQLQQLAALGTLAWEAAQALGSAILSGLLTGLKAVPEALADLGNLVMEAIKAAINVGIQAINKIIPDKIGVSIAGHFIGFDVPPNPIPELAAGFRNFAGGLALVGERGPELVALPRGSNVYPNAESRQMLNTMNIARQGHVFYGPINVYPQTSGGRDFLSELEARG
jgi:hypothetical protein